MTVNELAQLLIREHSESIDDADYITMLEGWIAEGVDKIGMVTNWKFFKKDYTFSTVASQAIYPLPDEATDLKYLRHVDFNTPIDYVDDARLVPYGEDLERTGRPTTWWFAESDLNVANFRNNIQLFPIPDAIYSISAPYYYIPISLTTSTQLPLQQFYISTLKLYVRAFMDKDDGDYDGYDRMMGSFNDQVVGLSNRNKTKTADNTRMQVTDIATRDNFRRLARLDPNHFR